MNDQEFDSLLHSYAEDKKSEKIPAGLSERITVKIERKISKLILISKILKLALLIVLVISPAVLYFININNKNNEKLSSVNYKEHQVDMNKTLMKNEDISDLTSDEDLILHLMNTGQSEKLLQIDSELLSSEFNMIYQVELGL